jgi:hypothetical protein
VRKRSTSTQASSADANQWLTAMIAQGYRSPVDDLRVLLDTDE